MFKYDFNLEIVGQNVSGIANVKSYDDEEAVLRDLVITVEEDKYVTNDAATSDMTNMTEELSDMLMRYGMYDGSITWHYEVQK
jgi:hypothetical protein